MARQTDSNMKIVYSIVGMVVVFAIITIIVGMQKPQETRVGQPIKVSSAQKISGTPKTTATTHPLSSCGDKSCASSENCLSCPQDCGQCPEPVSKDSFAVVGSADNGDVLLVVYNKDGVELWSKKFSLGASASGYGVAIDKSYNVVVAGTVITSMGGNDIFVRKYSPQGILSWTKTYSPGYDNIAYDIAVDPNDYTIVVVGEASKDSMSSPDYLIMKLKSTGDQAVDWDVNPWIRFYDRAGGTDKAHSVAIDLNGDIAVTGYTSPSGRIDTDYTTLKYDHLGKPFDRNGDGKMDVAIYDGGSHDQAFSVAFTKRLAGEIGVTGKSSIPYYDSIHTMRYYQDLTKRWEQTYTPSGTGSTAQGKGIAIDSSDNVAVTGTEMISSDSDYITIKYYSNGASEQWIKTYEGISNDIANAIAVDSGNHFIVTGYSYFSPGGFDFFTRKYDGAGNVKWSGRYIDGNTANDVAVAP